MAFSSTGFNTIGGQSKAGNAPSIYTGNWWHTCNVYRLCGQQRFWRG